jgi:hypothetical protein
VVYLTEVIVEPPGDPGHSPANGMNGPERR